MKPERIILRTCLALKAGESFLVVTDNTGERGDIADELLAEARLLTENAEKLVIPELPVNGAEPGISFEADVIVFLTSKSLSHTKARRDATKAGSRIASMPMITRDIMQRSIDVDYNEMKELTNRLADMLDSGSEVRITTDIGTDLRFSIRGRMSHGRKSGIFDKPGFWGNLPEGEAFIAPVEGSAEGVYFVDGSQAGMILAEPLEIHVKSGKAIVKNEELNEMLKSAGPDAFNIAEFGIGTNPKAKITGIVLEDEKVLGTCHIALGNNIGFGGNVDVPIHLDGVMKKPTIYVDERMIMQRGKFI